MYKTRKISNALIKQIHYRFSSQKITDGKNQSRNKSVPEKNIEGVKFTDMRYKSPRPTEISLKSDKFMRRTFTKIPTAKSSQPESFDSLDFNCGFGFKFSTSSAMRNQEPCKITPCKPKTDNPCKTEKKENPCKTETKTDCPCKVVPCKPKAKPGCP